MQISENNLSSFVVCINNKDYPSSLELHKIYSVIDDAKAEEEDIRIIDESGEDYLYPSSYFVKIQVPEIVKKSLMKFV